MPGLVNLAKQIICRLLTASHSVLTVCSSYANSTFRKTWIKPHIWGMWHNAENNSELATVYSSELWLFSTLQWPLKEEPRKFTSFIEKYNSWWRILWIIHMRHSTERLGSLHHFALEQLKIKAMPCDCILCYDTWPYNSQIPIYYLHFLSKLQASIQCVQYSKLIYIPLEDCTFTYITTSYAAEIHLTLQTYTVSQRLEHLFSKSWCEHLAAL